MAEYSGSYVRFNENLNIDYLKVESDTSIDLTTALDKYSTMQTYTILLATYGASAYTVDANYIPPDSSLYGAEIVLYRKSPNDSYYTYIATLTDGDFQFRDYNIMGNQYYRYLAAVMSMSSSGTPVYKIYEKTVEDESGIYDKIIFDTWSICNIEESTENGVYLKTGDTWNLGLNINGETATQHIAATSWDTLGRFGQVSSGIRNYDGGTFSGLLGGIVKYNCYTMPDQTRVVTESNGAEVVYGYYDGSEHTVGWYPLTSAVFKNGIKSVQTYTEKETASSSDTNLCGETILTVTNPYARETDKLIAWKEFISDGNLKLLRDTKGHGWIVAITDTNYEINNIATGQPTTVSFSWQEVEDKDNNSIILITS